MAIELPPPNVPNVPTGGKTGPTGLPPGVDDDVQLGNVSSVRSSDISSVQDLISTADSTSTAGATTTDLFNAQEALKRIQAARADLRTAAVDYASNPWFNPQAAVAFAAAMREFATSLASIQFQENLNAIKFMGLTLEIAQDLKNIAVNAAEKQAQSEIMQAAISFAQAGVSFASAASVAASRFKKSASKEVDQEIEQKQTKGVKDFQEYQTASKDLNNFNSKNKNVGSEPLLSPEENQTKTKEKLRLEKAVSDTRAKATESNQDYEFAKDNREKHINELALRKWHQEVQPFMQGTTQMLEGGKHIIAGTIGKEAELIKAEEPIFRAYQDAARAMFERSSGERKDFKDAMLQAFDTLSQAMSQKMQNKTGIGA